MKAITILLVEDNPGDVDLTKETIVNGHIINDMHVAEDGEQALQFLRKEGQFINAPRPDIILLDLNLPKVDGREILSIIKNDEQLKSIPVVVLTTSQGEEDISKMYKEHANCYITKPLDLDKFIEVVAQIKSFWFAIVKLPPRENHD